jgi:hypothetical protein
MKNKNYDVVKLIRQTRKRHTQETKHMSIAERMEYDRKKHESFMEKLSKVQPNNFDLPYIHFEKEKTNESDTESQ